MDNTTGMDNVSRKVLDDAKEQADNIISEAKEKASRVLLEAENKKAEKIDEGRALSASRYREVFERELSRVRAELNQELLLKKLQIVESVIEEAKRKLSGLDSGQYVKFLKKAFKTHGIKKGTYIIGKHESLLNDNLITSMAELEKSSSTPDFDRGIKVIDGNAEFLFSPESYLDMDIEDLKMEIASFLFGREK
ncbi:MAG: V-type ATP synthase subunit E [Actinobacteria bacterium]|nr:V-type ATP synthase subunit E [Actinomycetota bacterium]